MSTDKSSRSRRPASSRSINDTPAPGDLTGTKGSERIQVMDLLTGGSNEPGSTTRETTGNSKHYYTEVSSESSSNELIDREIYYESSSQTKST